MKLDMAPDPISKGDGGSNIPLFVIPKRKGRHGSALFQVPPSKQFGDLHRVERRALAKIVADAPEGKAVVDRAVVAHAADESRIEIGRASCRKEGVSTCRSRWSPSH